MSSIPLIVLGLFLIIGIPKSLIIVKENERGVVFRLGKFMHVTGPGLHIITPFIDKHDKINLNESIPDWQNMNDEDLEQKIRSIIISRQ